MLSAAGTYVMGHSGLGVLPAALLLNSHTGGNCLSYRAYSDRLSETPDIQLYTDVIFLALHGFMVLYGGLLSRGKKFILNLFGNKTLISLLLVTDFIKSTVPSVFEIRTS
jgi:hypothetical protein